MTEPALLEFLSLRVDSFVYGDGEEWTICADKYTSPLSFKYSISYYGQFVKGFWKNNLNILSVTKEKSLSGGCLERYALFSSRKTPLARAVLRVNTDCHGLSYEFHIF